MKPGKCQDKHIAKSLIQEDNINKPHYTLHHLFHKISATHITGYKYQPISLTPHVAHHTISNTCQNHNQSETLQPLQITITITITIGITTTKNGGSASWELVQTGKPTINHSTNNPNMNQPSALTTTILGIIHCLTYVKNEKIHANIVKINTTTNINKLKKPYKGQINHYWRYFNQLQNTYQIQFSNKADNLPRIRELVSMAKMYATQNNEIKSYMTPISATIIKIANQEIVEHLLETLLHTQHQHQIEQFMRNKYTWSQSTFLDINWDLHNDIHNHGLPYKQFITKLVHNWLPVASHPSQANENHQCFRCNITTEDQDHWYKCTCSDATAMQSQLRKNTIEFLHKSKLHYTLQHMIIDILYESKITTTVALQHSFQKQQTIGWHHFMRGRISQEWITIQNKLTNRDDGDKEWKLVISHMFHILHELWLDRNHQLHSNTESAMQRRMETIIKPKLTWLYNLQHLVSHEDKQLYETPLDQMLQFPVKYLER
jgi:hypothetical protein